MDKAKLCFDLGVALGNVIKAQQEAKACLERAVKEAGGFINTVPCDGKPELQCTMTCEGLDDELQTVYGLRYVEGEGLLLCTDDSISNYEFDNAYQFGDLRNPGKKDKKALDELLGSAEYFVSLEDSFMDENATVVNVLGGIASYLE